MSWWGGGNKSEASSAPKDLDFTADDEPSFGSGGVMAGGGGMSGLQEIQQASMILQQQMLVQQVINDLTDRSYEKCVTSKPSDALSGSQVACIRATVNKWLDTNEFMTGRLAKKSQRHH